MKNIQRYIIIFFVFMVISCSDDFINLAPVSQSNAENFYKTAEDFDAAVIGTYSNLQSPSQYGSEDNRFGGSFYALMEVRADDASDGDASAGKGKDVFDIDTFQDNTLSDVIGGAWLSIFKTIFDANVIVSRIEKVNIDKKLKNQYLAEARFLRALSYFNAVRLWGSVPIILTEITPEEAKKRIRNDVADVYKAIEADFKFAARNLPASFPGQEGRATSGAAKSFLGKVLITEKKWKEAANVLRGVVESGIYKLLPDVKAVFALDNEINDEIIFSVRFSNANRVSHLGFGTPAYKSLLAIYDAKDKRLPLLDPIGTGDADSTYPAKQFEGSEGPLGRDFPLLRYSDVLLMLSEALNESGYQANGDAFLYLNQVRTRAGVSNLSSSDAPTQESFRKAVWLERRLELPLELHRWFDLLRTNRAIEALSKVGITVKDYQLLYPIPQNDTSVYNDESRFGQNPGY